MSRPEIMELPQTFKANGYEYELLEHRDHLALYVGMRRGKTVCYEVHLMKWRDADEAIIGGKCVKFKEGWYPASNEEFGDRAWSYLKYDVAKRVFDTIKIVGREQTAKR